MLDFLTTKASLHTRGIHIDEKQYTFVLMCVLGERPEVAYGMTYHTKDFKNAMDSESEEKYLSSIRRDAEIRLAHQDEHQLYDLLLADYQSEIQTRAMNLENYQFTTGQVIQILQNLLHDRASDLESSSVKDVISLINTLASQGALQSGDNFGSHFIHIYPPFTSMCVQCGREFDIVKGINGVCPHCKQVYKWVEEEDRFYPKPQQL